VVVLRPPRLCIYCGQEFKNVRRGEHIVPNAIGDTLTVSDVCKEKKVCQQCNTGILSDLDNELCRQSFLSVVAATELSTLIGQCWDVDHDANNLLLEAEPDFKGESLSLYPQMIFETTGSQLRGDGETVERFGYDRFYNVFVRHMHGAFQGFKAGIDGRVHVKRIRLNNSLQGQYRYPPRLFARRPITRFGKGMSFELRFLDAAGRRRALSCLENWDLATKPRSYGRAFGSRMPSFNLTANLGKVVRGLAKMGINLLAAYCLHTLVNRDGFREVIRVIMDEEPFPPQLFQANGFVAANDIQPICVPSAHSFRLQYSGRFWHIYSSFFGGLIGAVVRFPGPNREDWVCADIVMPIRSRNATITKGRILQPLKVRVEWKDVGLIMPSFKTINPTTQFRVEEGAAPRMRGVKR
jgi:hypothetical protein